MKLKKTIASIILIALIMQAIMILIPEGVLAVENTREKAEQESQEVEIGREYEIKEEETWDVSTKQDGSVMAKWTLKDRTLVISGDGEMKDWDYYDENMDWHDNQYTNIIEKVIIKKGVTRIGESAFDWCRGLKNITIPEGVTSIDSFAFRGCRSLTNITIPKGVTRIEMYTFQYCSSLKNITIPEGVTNIESRALEGCSSLTNIEFPKTVKEIGTYAFKGCSSLKNITIPEGITRISQGSFEDCSNLSNIFIPKTVTEIKDGAFNRCTNLTNIIIPEGVTSIGSSAFNECSSLTNITIPKGINNIGEYAFNKCSNLQTINVDINNKNYMSDNGILFNKAKTVLIKYPINKKDVKEYTIPNSVKTIGDYAFERCNNLTKIKMSEEVTNIGKNAFAECAKLESINLSNKIVKIERETFGGCKELRELNLPESIKEIDFRAFEECNSLINITIPKNVIAIKEEVFNKCENLRNVTILGEIESIESSAFYGCNSLENINIPQSLKSIGYRAFVGCGNLKNINIPEGVTDISSEVFYPGTLLHIKADSKIHEWAENQKQPYILEGQAIDIKNEYEIEKEKIWDVSEKQDRSILAKWSLDDRRIIISGSGKMKDWTDTDRKDWHSNKYTDLVGEVIIENGVTNIGIKAFYNCRNLTNIKMPESITEIGYQAFAYCIELKDLIIPEKLTKIKENAFEYCAGLVNINIPEKIEIIGEEAFKNCNNLKRIDVDSKNEKYISIDGVLFSKNGTKIIKYPAKKEENEYNIPEGVISIENGAFAEGKKLIRIGMPEGITSIGTDAFKGCINLTNIEIPKEVTELGYRAFYECNNLTNITIPEGVTYIGDEMFYECNNLTNIEIPQKVTGIGDYVFLGCISLTNITIPEGVMNIGEGAFFRCSSLTDIEIPEGVTKIKDYLFRYCSNLTNIVIPNGVTSIGKNAFERCNSLKNIEIPERVTSIENGLFQDCSNLINITIPNGVTSIGENAFEGCSSLANIEIPEGVTSIGRYAFSGCGNVKNLIISKNITTIGEKAIDSRILIYTKNSTEGHRYAEEQKQGYIIDEKSPEITYTPNGENKIQKQHQVKVKITDTKVGVEENSSKYQWTQRTEEPSKESFKEFLKNGQNITKNNGDGIWYLWVYAKDKVGNEIIKRSEGYNFDNTAPNIEVKYNTTNPTRENVIVTIVANEEIQEIEGWEMSKNKKEITKEYTENMEEKVVIKDKLGNQTEAKVSVRNIDKIKPVIEVKYSTTNPTRENVIVTIVANEEIQEIEGWEMSGNKKEITKEYAENVEETLMVKDKLGNQTEAKVNVKNIDKVKPVVEVKYSTINPTRENVTVIITSNEEIQEVEGWKMSENKKEITKEYAENVEETLTVKDKAGNITQVKIIIKNILPEIQIGDINEDKRIDITDLLLLKRHIIAGGKEDWKLTEEKLQRADINESGNVDITDLIMLKKKNLIK